MFTIIITYSKLFQSETEGRLQLVNLLGVETGVVGRKWGWGRGLKEANPIKQGTRSLLFV